MLNILVISLIAVSSITGVNNSAERMELVEEKKVQIEERKEDKLQHREEIQEMKNEKLRERLLKFSDKFSDLSSKWATHWEATLNRLTGILDKIETRSAELVTEGEDVSNVDVALAEARAAIVSAQTAVDSLVTNVYSFEVSDEDTIGGNVREQISEFREDSASVRTSVKTANEAVHAAFQELRKVFSNNEK